MSVTNIPIIARAKTLILDFFFPKNPLAEIIENLPLHVFMAKTQRDISGRAIFSYRDPIVNCAVRELKYRGNRKIASLLAATLFEEIASQEDETSPFLGGKKPLLIPVPISKKRRRQRGFNQCELLLSSMPPEYANFFETGLNLLIKPKETKTQTGSVTREKRLTNLHGAFEVASPGKVAGRRIIVVDDVTTTGATFEEARRALRRAGARDIKFIAVAH